MIIYIKHKLRKLIS